MRPLGVALRVPVEVRTAGDNYGDGPTAGTTRRERANVKGTRQVRRSSTGDTVVDPYVLEFAHNVDVPVGATIVVDGNEARVESSELVRGAFGVPHHREVRAL